MKKLFLMTFLTVSLTANAEEKNEIVFVNDANMVAFSVNDSIFTSDGGLKIAKGKDDNDRWSMHFALGVNVPTGAPDGVEFASSRSWELNWTIAQYDYTPKNSKTTLSAGLGFNWRAYTLKGHKNGFFKVKDVVGVSEFGAEFDEFSSNIHTTALSMPLLVKQKFSKNFAITLGAQLNWNYYARLHNYQELNDYSADEYIKNIGHRPFTVDVLGIVDVCKGFGVYCKYSPMSVLKKDRGPEFQSLAFGIYF